MSSCRTSNDTLPNQKFNYDAYNAKNALFTTLNKVNLKKNVAKTTNLNEYENALATINDEFGTNVSKTEFDEYIINNPTSTIDDFVQSGYISQDEYNIVDSFFTDLETYNFDEAKTRLETRILDKNYSNSEFQKYNFLVNQLMITNDYYVSHGVDIFAKAGTNKNISKRISASCAVSIAANAISTYGLMSCFVPGPNCWVALAGKGLSLASIFLSC
ncbi:hypothetical protein [Halpernia frigidisoli]|nr:hypothetical protein [Halpernia frigidisoli]